MTERLYSLLPQVHRLRDGTRGEPLRALLRVLESAYDEVRDDVGVLSDAWFIETCPDELVPYIGDLVDARLTAISAAPRVSARAYVADALGLRRRKGTVHALEQAARAATGWPCRVVEGHRVTAATADLRGSSRTRLGTPEIRDAATVRHAGTGLDALGHTVDIHAPETSRGTVTGAGRLGIHLYRMRRFEIDRSECRYDSSVGGYRVCPLGLESVLLNAPRSESDIDHLATEEDLPVRLDPVPLQLELQREDGARPHWFGAHPCVRIFVADSSGAFVEVEPASLQVGLLTGSPWPPPDSGKSAAFDPIHGRITLPAASAGAKVLVTTGYGAHADIGGGPYSREDSVREMLGATPDWQAVVTSETSATAPEYATLDLAITAWNARMTAGDTLLGLILLEGSRNHAPTTTITLANGSRLVIAAGSWPAEEDGSFDEGTWAARGQRAFLDGNLTVDATAVDGGSADQSLGLSGLWIDGTVTVEEGQLARLHVADCTVVPVEGGAGITCATGSTAGTRNDELRVVVERSVLAHVACDARIAGLSLTDSIVGGEDPGNATLASACVTAAGAHLEVEGCTLFGTVVARSVQASNSLFMGALTTWDRQRGYVRYSYLAEGSRTPRRYACQPDGVGTDTAMITAVRPAFHGVSFVRAIDEGDLRDPAYGRLTVNCAREIREGADDGGEMGVFHHLREREREKNLQQVERQFVRIGARVGVFFES